MKGFEGEIVRTCNAAFHIMSQSSLGSFGNNVNVFSDCCSTGGRTLTLASKDATWPRSSFASFRRSSIDVKIEERRHPGTCTVA